METNTKIWIVGILVMLFGIVCVTIAFLNGNSTITGFSANSALAGTREEPYLAYINFTANKDMMISPDDLSKNGNSELKLFPAVKAWALQIKEGDTWREIGYNMTCENESCTQSNNTIQLKNGEDYQARLIIEKQSPNDTIKIDAFSAKDTIKEATADYVFPSLTVSKEGEAIFKVHNFNGPISKDKLKIFFIEKCGKVKDYSLHILGTCSQVVPVYGVRQECKEDINTTTLISSVKCADYNFLEKYANESTPCFKDFTEIPTGDSVIYLESNIKWEKCEDKSFGYKIDWIPSVTLDKKYIQSKWSWWNNTYLYKMPINCSKIASGTPIVINGTKGVNIAGSNHIIWTKCEGSNTALYYNTASSYAVANLTTKIPLEIESGTGSNYQRTSVWEPKARAIFHYAIDSKTNISDSTTYSHDGTRPTGAVINYTSGKIGGAYANHKKQSGGSTSNLQIAWGNSQNLLNLKNQFTIMAWFRPYINATHSVDTITSLENTQSSTANKNSGIALYRGGDNRVGWYNNAEIILAFGTTVANVWATRSPIKNATFTHLVITRNGGTGKLYFNGTLKNSTTRLNSGDISWNGNGYDHSQYMTAYALNTGFSPTMRFSGAIDEFRVYNYTLSAAEINYTYYNFMNRNGYGNAKAAETRTSSCPCPAINNNWDIQLVDHCNITSACDIGTGKLSFSGVGYFNCNAVITTKNLGDPGITGKINIQPNCKIIVN